MASASSRSSDQLNVTDLWIFSFLWGTFPGLKELTIETNSWALWLQTDTVTACICCSECRLYTLVLHTRLKKRNFLELLRVTGLALHFLLIFPFYTKRSFATASLFEHVVDVACIVDEAGSDTISLRLVGCSAYQRFLSKLRYLNYCTIDTNEC